LASSMVAAIKSNLDLTAQLVEGHDGIFLVTVNGQTLFNNSGKCSQRPENGDIIKSIQAYLGSTSTATANTAGTGCCSDVVQSAEPAAGSCCCAPQAKSGQQACCAPQGVNSPATGTEKRHMVIEFLYLDLNVCVPCRGTESSLEEAISEVSRVLEATGIEVEIHKIHVQSEEQALELGFISSPTIRINGRDIQLEVKESLCESCGDLCGDDVDCRVWIYQGKEYSIPPKGLIIEAILREVYAGASDGTTEKSFSGELPDNLKNFFARLKQKAKL